MFFIAGILLPLIAVIWLFAYPKLVKAQEEQSDEMVQNIILKNKQNNIFWVSVCILALFAVIDNLVKDGLTIWVPMILKEIYVLPDYISILLTMVLPMLAIFGTSVAVMLNKKIKDFVMLSAILFLLSALLIGLVILFLPTGFAVVTLGSFGIISCLMSVVNNIITSMVPLYWTDKINSGMLAGVLNGFCYLGSTLSSYGLGVIADAKGWEAVFLTLLVLCVVTVVVAISYWGGKIFAKR
jgi:OPA family glycerol-3-phosphate transporter-like MFS transporter